jgi:hypothetical protein
MIASGVPRIANFLNIQQPDQQEFIRCEYLSDARVTSGAKHSGRTTMWVSSNSIHARIGDFGFTHAALL